MHHTKTKKHWPSWTSQNSNYAPRLFCSMHCSKSEDPSKLLPYCLDHGQRQFCIIGLPNLGPKFNVSSYLATSSFGYRGSTHEKMILGSKSSFWFGSASLFPFHQDPFSFLSQPSLEKGSLKVVHSSRVSTLTWLGPLTYSIVMEKLPQATPKIVSLWKIMDWTPWFPPEYRNVVAWAVKSI